MKTISPFIYILFCGFSLILVCRVHAQTNTFPTTGNVGIGTTTPSTFLEVKSGVDLTQTSTQYVGPLTVGGANDYGAGGALQYVLLFPQYNGTVGEVSAGLSGVLREYRGGASSSNADYEYDIVGQTAYSTSYINLIPKTLMADVPNIYTVTYSGVPYLAIKASELIYSGGLFTFTGHFWNNVNTTKPQLVLATACSNISIVQSATYLAGGVISVNTSQYVGVGTTNPQVPLHVSGGGVPVDAGNTGQFSGDLSIQANTGGRSMTSGAELEFIIPAASNGTNFWGQGRIITVANDTVSGNAVGKMIFGTRRYFNKLGTGNQWYYGNDITIDGGGSVGIGTLHPQSLFSVEGNITAKQITILQTGWSDFVFDSTYQKMSLDNVSQFISRYKHLPQIPSSAEIEKVGLDIGAMQKLHMQKIEELTLYAIDADTHAKAQDALIAELQGALKSLQQEIEALKQLIKAQK